MTDREYDGWCATAERLYVHGLPARFPAWEMRRLSAYLRQWWADRT
jgi:hypothetical protein